MFWDFKSLKVYPCPHLESSPHLLIRISEYHRKVSCLPREDDLLHGVKPRPRLLSHFFIIDPGGLISSAISRLQNAILSRLQIHPSQELQDHFVF